MWHETVHDIEVNLNHTSDTLTLKFTSTLNQLANDESWGIRDVVVYVASVNATTPLTDGPIPYYQAFMTNYYTASDNWVTTDTNSTAVVSACGQDRIYGGFGIFGARASSTYMLNNLPPHSEIRMRFKLYVVGSWDRYNITLTVSGIETFDDLSIVSQGQ